MRSPRSAVIRYIVDVGFLERIVTPEGRKVWRGTNGDTPIKSASITINGVTLDVPVFGDLPEGNGYAEHTGTGAALDAVNHQTLAFRENFNNTTVVSYVSTFVGSYSSNFVPSDDMSVPVDYQVKSDDVVYGTFYIHSRDLLGDKWNYIAEADFRTERVQIGLLSAVPEPTTWAMMIAGFALTGARARRAREWKTA